MPTFLALTMFHDKENNMHINGRHEDSQKQIRSPVFSCFLRQVEQEAKVWGRRSCTSWPGSHLSVSSYKTISSSMLEWF